MRAVRDLSPVVESLESDRLVAWIAEAKQGSSEAMTCLLVHIRRRLYRFCLYLSRDPQRAEDLCQETLARIAGSLRFLRRPERFQSWVFRAAKNRFLDWSRMPGQSAFPVDPAELDMLSTGEGSSGEIRSALRALRPADREVLLIVDLEGKSYREAAQELGLSVAAVRSRLSRARANFEAVYRE